MSPSPRRGWRRWVLWSVALAVTGLILWQASGFVAARWLERQLRDAGWIDARVAGGGVALRDVTFDRVQLSADPLLVAENLRARVGRGIERISIERVGAEVELTTDGEWRLPRSRIATESAPLSLDALPADGVAIRRAEVRAASPLGVVDLTLTDLLARHGADRAELSGRYAARLADTSASPGAPTPAVQVFRSAGNIEAELHANGDSLLRLAIEDGDLAGLGIRAAGLTGDADASLPYRGSPSFEVAAAATTVDAAGVALGRVAMSADWRDNRARFSIRAPTAELAEIAIDGEAVLGAADVTASLAGRVALAPASPAQGRIEFDAELASAAADLSVESRVRGRVAIDGAGLGYPGLFEDGALALSADVDGNIDELQIVLGTVRAELVPAPELVPDSARSLDGAALTLQLGADEQAPSLRWSRAQRAAELHGRLAASAAEASIATTLRARVSASGSGGGNAGTGPFAIEADVADLVAQSLSWDELVLGAEAFAGTVEYADGEWRIDGAGKLAASGSAASIRLDDAVADFTGALTATSERLSITVRDCVRFRAGSIEIDGTQVADLAPLCVRGADDGTLLVHDSDATRLTLSLDEQPLRARVSHAEAGYTLEGRWPSIIVDSETQTSGTRVSARFSGGELSSEEARLAVRGVNGSAQLRNGALVAAAMRIERVESLARPALVAPVGVELAAEGRLDALAFEAVVSDALGTFVVEAAGSREPEKTTAHVRLYPLRFVTGATEIGDLSPRLAELVVGASGVVELEGDVEWAGDALIASGTFSARDFGATVFGIAFAGLDTEMRLTSLVPLATAPEQTVTIARIDLGMPLEQGTAVFDLDSNGVLAVHRLDFGFAGGRLFAEPFTLDSGSPNDIGFVLRAEDVELSHFLALSRIDGLAGTGVLSGRVPVRLIDGGIRLDEGLLSAETDGVLRYTPNDLPDFLRGDDVRSQMLREVLTNFEYEELSLAVSGESGEGGEQTLTLSARGANPDFLDGHPIELAFNFRGPLLGAVRSAVDLTGAAELEQVFEQRETDNEENSR